MKQAFSLIVQISRNYEKKAGNSESQLKTIGILHSNPLADPRGVLGTCPPPPPGPISLIFMQFSAKILPNNRFPSTSQGLVLCPQILDPPLQST